MTGAFSVTFFPLSPTPKVDVLEPPLHRIDNLVGTATCTSIVGEATHYDDDNDYGEVRTYSKSGYIWAGFGSVWARTSARPWQRGAVRPWAVDSN